MTDVLELLRRQAEWQTSGKDLPWPEKLRMVAAVRESILKLRNAPLWKTEDGGTPRPPPTN